MPPPPGRRLKLVLQVLFVLLGLVIFALAILPVSSLETGGNDKIKHAAAFYTLALTALIAFPRSSPWVLAAGLLGFGLVIEVVQGLPAIGRDRDLYDVVADGIGIGLALAPFIAGRLRQWVLSAAQ